MENTNRQSEPENGSYDQINGPLVLVVLVSSAIFFGGVVIPATMALNFYYERVMARTNVVEPADEALTSHRLAQAAKITRYRWVDQAKGVAAIPIDRAMAIYVQRQAQPPAAGSTAGAP